MGTQHQPDAEKTENFDVEGNLGAVERSVSSLERDGQSAHGVTLSRSYSTTIEDLWDAVTNSGRLPRWFLSISGELELGGHYQLKGHAGGSEEWRRAAIAIGTDPDAAREAARRTTAFYTGESLEPADR